MVMDEIKKLFSHIYIDISLIHWESHDLSPVFTEPNSGKMK